MQVVGITEHLRRHHGPMVPTGEGASTVIPCLSFPTERPRRRSHHLQRDHQAEHGVRNTPKLGLTREPDLLQVALAGCAEAAAAVRASERPPMCPWVETAQRPAPTRMSGNTHLQEAPSCFEAEVMEGDRAHSGLQTRGHVGLGARRGCSGMPGHPHAHAARRVLGAFFPVRPQTHWQGGTCLALFLVWC